MAEIGKGETFTDAAFPINRNDLRFLSGFALRHFEGRLLLRLIAQAGIEILKIGNIEGHSGFSQFKIIFRQAASSKA